MALIFVDRGIALNPRHVARLALGQRLYRFYGADGECLGEKTRDQWCTDDMWERERRRIVEAFCTTIPAAPGCACIYGADELIDGDVLYWTAPVVGWLFNDDEPQITPITTRDGFMPHVGLILFDGSVETHDGSFDNVAHFLESKKRDILKRIADAEIAA